MERQQTALLTFMRHGEKSDDGALTEMDHAQARKIGQRTQTLSGDIMLFHGGVGRVRDTVRAMAANLHLTDGATEALELGEHIVDYVAPNPPPPRRPKGKGELLSALG